MAGQITDLSALTGADLADDDLFEVVDISDTTMAASGTNKKITRAELAIGLGATRVYKTDLAYNTPNLGDLTYATCPIIYTPAVGDVLLDVVMRVTTATNNNIGLFVGTTNDLTNGVDATDQVINFRPLYADVTADLSYGNTNASAVSSFSNLQLYNAVNNTASQRFVPAVFTSTAPLRVYGDLTGATQGAFTFYVIVATPI